MAVSDPNKFASVGNVKALFDSGEGFVHEANIDPDYALVPLTGSTGQVLTRTEGGVGWAAPQSLIDTSSLALLWEGSATISFNAPGSQDYDFFLVLASAIDGSDVCTDGLFVMSRTTTFESDFFLGVCPQVTISVSGSSYTADGYLERPSFIFAKVSESGEWSAIMNNRFGTMRYERFSTVYTEKAIIKKVWGLK